MNEHSILAPSSAARRVACPGSRALEAQFPNEDSQFSKEGQAAHWVASEILRNSINPNSEAGAINEGSICPNGEIVTEQMIEGAEIYTKTIHVFNPSFSHTIRSLDKRIHIEEKISISSIHPECWGTPDCWFFSESEELYIFDYKFGFGFVEVFENWQLLEYAAGILEYLKNKTSKENWDRYVKSSSITFCIVQPRTFNGEGPIRFWNIKISKVFTYFEKLILAEELAMRPKAPCIPNPECKYCLARPACPALQNTVLSTIDLTKLNTPHNLDSVGLGTELRYLKQAANLLDARITGLEEQAISEIKRGKRVPFFRIKETAGHKRWTKPASEIITMGAILGHDLAKSVEAITPVQALKKDMPEELVNAFSEIPRGSLKLIEDTLSNTRKLFKE